MLFLRGYNFKISMGVNFRGAVFHVYLKSRFVFKVIIGNYTNFFGHQRPPYIQGSVGTDTWPNFTVYKRKKQQV